ncbi:MAG: hypothetical protein JWM77_2613 [Rhodospirillales bacterium]|jgi:hypothetical protein|nr:hypothetical protein [Rhodospirillales bacterium]
MRKLLLATAALLAISTAAATPPPDTKSTPDTSPPRTNNTIPTEPGQRRADETLSDKLDRSDGVLHPGPTPDPSVRTPPIRQGNERDIVVPPTEKSPAVDPKN